MLFLTITEFYHDFLRYNLILQEIKICAAIMNMFQLLPAASSKLIEPLVQLTVNTERALILEVSKLCILWSL